MILIALEAGSKSLDGDTAQPSDLKITVALDAAEQSGHAEAIIRIHATREVVWSLITSCKESMSLIPSLVFCEVVETAPDHSWQRIHHVMNYSWYLPKISYDILATYDPPAHVLIERLSGDLRTLRGSWELQSDGDYTVAYYQVDLAPGFRVPKWLIKSALRRDLPKMLQALRFRAEMLAAMQP